MKFSPAKPRRVYADIVEQIETAILEGRIKPGDHLPSERELYHSFNTSRGPIREALRTLEQKGLIQIQKGPKGGALVKSLELGQISESLAFLVRHNRVPAEQIVEFREVLDGVAARLAAERARDSDLDHLKKLHGELKDHQSEELWDLFWDTEREMHGFLAKMSGNLMIEWVLSTVHMELKSYNRFYPTDDRRAQEAIDDWREIISALEKGQANRACSLLRMHVMNFNRES